MGAGGRPVAAMWRSRPAAGACFHYLKASVCEELRGM